MNDDKYDVFILYSQCMHIIVESGIYNNKLITYSNTKNTINLWMLHACCILHFTWNSMKPSKKLNMREVSYDDETKTIQMSLSYLCNQ